MMLRIKFGIFLLALTTLMMELLLIRVFDVILNPSMAYLVISCAMFSFGLAGIYSALWPLPEHKAVRKFASMLALVFALVAFFILPIMNVLPFDYNEILSAPLVQVVSFTGMFLTLVVPFFCAGLVFATIFSAYPGSIQSLYFWDLIGAGLGCLILIPFLPMIGPGGLLFWASALGLVTSGILSTNRMWMLVTLISGIVLLCLPIAKAPDYYDFSEHLDKRGVKEARILGNIELTRWDPISKIDIFDKERNPGTPEAQLLKHIAYDGGTQSSLFYPFDGNYERLRDNIATGKEGIRKHFWHWGVIASHYLKRDQNQQVLIIGSAGGQEVKAALLYGASHIDAVELVGAVVQLGKQEYAKYTGNIFNHPNVDVRVGEGRSFLRQQKTKYDIIQIFSNHSSSSIAAGTGAMDTTYLQTEEAYREYFGHLTHNGVLHINHHVYPKMITTAALAWKKIGKKDFQKHVVVFERPGVWDTLPTVLIKMQPWTKEEINEFQTLSSLSFVKRHLVEDPLNPEKSFLSQAFYSGAFPSSLAENIPFNIQASTDDKPYFNFLRKKMGFLNPDSERFVNISTAELQNSQMRKFIPMDIIHLIVIGVISLSFAGLFIGLPMYFSREEKSNWPRKMSTMVYFSCLGLGFILFEIVLIQIFKKLIGFPLYTYSTVVFMMLLSAGIGSLCSGKLHMTIQSRWYWPFCGLAISSLSFFLVYPYLFDTFLASPLLVRVFVCGLLLFPLGFFLGMPFPIGILSLEKMPKSVIAWAWGLNGFFTLVGGLASVIISIYFGFKVTLMFALFVYFIAFVMLARMRTVSHSMSTS